jgi:hypothetical protein
MLSHYALEDQNKWMNEVIVMTDDGLRLVGEYDGYGRVNGLEIEWGEEPCCYHRDCWEVEGKPDYTGPSKPSDDQGWFYEDGVHNIPSPLKKG